MSYRENNLDRTREYHRYLDITSLILKDRIYEIWKGKAFIFAASLL